MRLVYVVYVILALLLSVANCENKFIRTVYYGEFDNICLYNHPEQIQVLFIFPDLPPIKGIIDGSTCQRFMPPYYQDIRYHQIIGYFQCPDDQQLCDQAEFNQQQKIYYRYTQVIGIRFFLTPINPMRFNQKNYQCEILGSGQSTHFGPTQYDTPMPLMTVKCDHIAQQIE